MAQAFISYSHKDDRVLDRLKVHMRMLERDGVITAWSDRAISAGGEVDEQIARAQAESLLFLPIVSPDFLDSNYCYELEMKTAIKKAENRDVIIVPIIAEPCDWLSSPLAKFKALPRDGKPISEWANENNAYLDIVRELRRVIQYKPKGSPVVSNATTTRPSLRIKKHFTTIDRFALRDKSFDEIRDYFRRSIDEIGGIEEIQSRFEEMSSTAFTCSVVNRSRSNSESHLTVRNSKGGRSSIGGDIVCSNTAYASDNSANQVIRDDADDYAMFLSLTIGNRFFMGANREEKLSAAQVADILLGGFHKVSGH